MITKAFNMDYKIPFDKSLQQLSSKLCENSLTNMCGNVLLFLAGTNTNNELQIDVVNFEKIYK